MQSPRGGQGTFYKYKSKYGGMEPSDASRLRMLEAENSKLKKLLAEIMDLSRFSAAPRSHLSGNPFESQGAFPA